MKTCDVCPLGVNSVVKYSFHRNSMKNQNKVTPKMTIVRHSEHSRRRQEPDEPLPYVPEKSVRQKLQVYWSSSINHLTFERHISLISDPLCLFIFLNLMFLSSRVTEVLSAKINFPLTYNSMTIFIDRSFRSWWIRSRQWYNKRVMHWTSVVGATQCLQDQQRLLNVTDYFLLHVR